MAPLLVDPNRLRYHALIGTGGIGTGSFFALNGNHTLGREESRTGRFLGNRDYAKLHIVAHYVQALMGPAFKTLPIGRVGADEAGHRLCDEMDAAGLDLRYVHKLDGVATMNCVCLLYPDGSGGNLTINDSACEKVDSASIREALPDFARFEGRGIALAAPEVPLNARDQLLNLAAQHRLFRVASFTSEEIQEGRASAMLEKVDLLVINCDEAAALAAVSSDWPPRRIAKASVQMLASAHVAMQVMVTAGAEGSWAWDGRELIHLPAHAVDAVSSAGAGDAFLAGTLSGLACGLSLPEAQQLGGLTGALSVTSPHTINEEIDRLTLAAFAEAARTPIADNVRTLLACSEGEEDEDT